MDIENLIKLVNAVSESKLTSFSYEENGVSISFGKESVKEIVTANVVTESKVEQVVSHAVAEPESTGKVVKSPLVGVFYVAPGEDKDPYVSVGDKVKKGQVLAIVEAMKLMNEIESEFDGTIVEVLVENGQTVEYGQPLFRIA